MIEAVVAFSLYNFLFVWLAIMFAIVVFPVPLGPYKIKLGTFSAQRSQGLQHD